MHVTFLLKSRLCCVNTNCAIKLPRHWHCHSFPGPPSPLQLRRKLIAAYIICLAYRLITIQLKEYFRLKLSATRNPPTDMDYYTKWFIIQHNNFLTLKDTIIDIFKLNTV
jgi:hypothetical protein